MLNHAKLESESSANAMIMRLGQFTQSDIAEYVAAVIAQLTTVPRVEKLSLQLAYVCARDPEALTYFAARAFAQGLELDQAVSKMAADLEALVESDFGDIALFELFIEPLFAPTDSLYQRMQAVERFALDDDDYNVDCEVRAA